MSTPNAHTDLIDSHDFRASDEPAPNADGGGAVNNQVPRDVFSALNRVFYAIAAIAGIGFLMVLFGAYVSPKIWAHQTGITVMIAGAIVMVLAVVAWIAAAILMISMMIMRLIRNT